MSVARGFSDSDFQDYKLDVVIAFYELEEHESLLRKLSENQEPLSSEECQEIIKVLQEKLSEVSSRKVKYFLSLAYLDKSDLDSAKKVLNEILVDLPTDLSLYPMVVFRLALIYQAEGNTQEAINRLKNLPKYWKFPAVQKVLSDHYREIKDTVNLEQALRDLWAALPLVTPDDAVAKNQVNIEFLELYFARTQNSVGNVGREAQLQLMLQNFFTNVKKFPINIFFRMLKLLQTDMSVPHSFDGFNDERRKQFYDLLKTCLEFPEVQKALWHGFIYPASPVGVLLTPLVKGSSFFKKLPETLVELRAAFLSHQGKAESGLSLPEQVTFADIQTLGKRDKALFQIVDKHWDKVCVQRFEKVVLGEEEKSVSADKEKKEEDASLMRQASLLKEMRSTQDISKDVNDKFISNLMKVEVACPEMNPSLYDTECLLSIIMGRKIDRKIQEQALWKIFATTTPFGQLFAKLSSKKLSTISCFLLGVIDDKGPQMDEGTKNAFRRDPSLLDKMGDDLKENVRKFLEIPSTAPGPK